MILTGTFIADVMVETILYLMTAPDKAHTYNFTIQKIKSLSYTMISYYLQRVRPFKFISMFGTGRSILGLSTEYY